MYNVLKPSKGSSEEQSLAKLSDHANKLIRQVEASIETAEHARATRRTLGNDGARTFSRLLVGPVLTGVHKSDNTCCHSQSCLPRVLRSVFFFCRG